MHPGCGTLESSVCVYAPDAPTAIRATASAVNAYTNALSFLNALRDAITRRFSTRVESRSESVLFRVLDVGIVSPERATSRLAQPIDDATSANSLNEVSRRDAAGAVRCDDGSAGAVRCDDESARIVRHRAPSISWILTYHHLYCTSTSDFEKNV